MKRVEASDPAAMNEMGTECYEAEDYDSAVEQLNWEVWMRIVIWDLCMGRGMVLRGTRESKYIIMRRLPLVDILMLDTILVV